MHGEQRRTAIQDIHTRLGQKLGNGSPATFINFPKFTGLPHHLIFVETTADKPHKLSPGIAGPRLSPGTGELGNANPMAKPCGIHGLMDLLKIRIHGCINIGGQGFGLLQDFSQLPFIMGSLL